MLSNSHIRFKLRPFRWLQDAVAKIPERMTEKVPTLSIFVH